MERGEKITYLEYEQYDGMAEAELETIGRRNCPEIPYQWPICKHRIGKVNVGETSLHVVIWSKHRQEGIDAMSWFIAELKKRIPIWKWAILEDGSRVPSECIH